MNLQPEKLFHESWDLTLNLRNLNLHRAPTQLRFGDYSERSEDGSIVRMQSKIRLISLPLDLCSQGPEALSGGRNLPLCN